MNGSTPELEQEVEAVNEAVSDDPVLPAEPETEDDDVEEVADEVAEEVEEESSVLGGVSEARPDDLLVLRCVYEDAPPGALINVRNEADQLQINQWDWEANEQGQGKRVIPVIRADKLQRLGFVAQWKVPKPN